MSNKVSKEDASYTDGPVTIRPCKWCFWRLGLILGKGQCQLVRGWISELGSCALWKRAMRI